MTTIFLTVYIIVSLLIWDSAKRQGNKAAWLVAIGWLPLYLGHIVIRAMIDNSNKRNKW